MLKWITKFYQQLCSGIFCQDCKDFLSHKATHIRCDLTYTVITFLYYWFSYVKGQITAMLGMFISSETDEHVPYENNFLPYFHDVGVQSKKCHYVVM